MDTLNVSLSNLQNIWASLFEKNIIKHYDNDDNFLPIFMLLDILYSQMNELKSKYQNCKCYKDENTTLTNSSVKSNASRQVPLEEDFNVSDIDIVNNSNIFTKNEVSPILKGKNNLKRRRTTVVKKQLFNKKKNESIKENEPKQSVLEFTKRKKQSKIDFQKCDTKKTSAKLPKLSLIKHKSLSDSPLEVELRKSEKIFPKQCKSEVKHSSPRCDGDSKSVETLYVPDSPIKEHKLQKPLQTRNFNIKHGDNLAETFYVPIPTEKNPLNEVIDLVSSDQNDTEMEEDLFAETYFCPNTEKKMLPSCSKNDSPNEKKSPMDQNFNKKCKTVEAESKSDSLSPKDKFDKKEKEKTTKVPLDDSYDIPPKPNDKPNFVYRRDAVRKKQDRLKLPGQTCPQCEKYYNQLDEKDKERLKDRLNKCSRHRDNLPQSYTPPGFWNPLFPPTQED